MGLLGKTAKNVIKALRREYLKIKKRRNSRFDGSERSSPNSSAATKKSSLKTSASSSSMNNSDDPLPQSSLDSGISESSSMKKNPKNLRVSTAHMQEYEINNDIYNLDHAKGPNDKNSSQTVNDNLVASSSSSEYIDPFDLPSRSRKCRLVNSIQEPLVGNNLKTITEGGEMPNALGQSVVLPCAKDEETPNAPLSSSLPDSKPKVTKMAPRSFKCIAASTPFKFSTPMSNNNSKESAISETLHSSDFQHIATSNFFDELTKKSLNVIHNTDWSLKVDELLKDTDCQVGKKSPQDVSLEHKFVINLFESRPSKRWAKVERENNDIAEKDVKKVMEMKHGVMLHNHIDANIEMLELESKQLVIETKKIEKELELIEKSEKNTKPPQSVLDIQRSNNEENTKEINKDVEKEGNNSLSDRCTILKKMRDKECSKMAEASNALKKVKGKTRKNNWLEVLMAEKILLETSELVKVLDQQIRDASYTVIPEQPLPHGILHLANVKYHFASCWPEKYKKEEHFTQFFVMGVCYGTEIYFSKFLTSADDHLYFRCEYIFRKVAPDFEIKLKLFYLRMRTSDRYFWQRFCCSRCCKKSQIIYEDYLTSQYQERKVLKTSFNLCAEATLTHNHIDSTSTRLTIQSQVFAKLDGTVWYSFKCDEVDMTVSLSSFLDVGTLLGESYYWERRWCTLKGPQLKIYNYPLDEYNNTPINEINLKYCFGSIITKVENCSKKRCFQLSTGRPDTIDDKASALSLDTLRTKSNFVLQKFYFAARNKDEYEQWTGEVTRLLTALSYFKKLVFDEEYDPGLIEDS